ncbi:methyltransferase domain-containing protein [Streptomyces varsoviensis]|uniref:class I SAM-dependent methyltransferase n=1 Tax=Streptomyces varsoviensis TaxID=67373 RepID=UPI0033E6CD84
MPTIPAGRSPHPAPEPHEHREMAESFGVDAERYDRARPRYPKALIDRTVAACARTAKGPDRAPDHPPRILDVGCGTGIAAQQFAAAGCEVLGVDADARMAELARRHGLPVEVASFEAWDPAGREFDAVVAAQAWHWVDPVAGAAKAARTLRPGGLLAAFWNAGGLPPGLAEAFTEVYERVLPGSLAARQWSASTDDAYAALCAKAADGIREAGAYGEPEEWRFDWEWTYTRDAWLDLLPTTGPHTTLPPERMAEVLSGVGAVVDAVGGCFTMRYTTVAVAAARTDAA